jgi:hypothetical protein
MTSSCSAMCCIMFLSRSDRRCSTPSGRHWRRVGPSFSKNGRELTLLSFGVVTPLGYLMHSSFTFRERLSLRGFLRFTSGIAAGFPLLLLSMAILCTGLGLPVVIAAPIATIILFLWNYASVHWAILDRWRA